MTYAAKPLDLNSQFSTLKNSLLPWDVFSLSHTIQVRGGKAGWNFFPAGCTYPWDRIGEEGHLHMIPHLRRVENTGKSEEEREKRRSGGSAACRPPLFALHYSLPNKAS
jgi:hypothetical protein